ncbi:MAG: hypothetical protein ACRC2T_19570, partial [Thermoguttaceae bacterium]
SLISDMSTVEPTFDESYDRVKTLLQRSGVEMDTNWMDVAAKNTTNQRNLAQAVLGSLPDMKKIAKDATENKRKFRESLSSKRSSFEWGGILAYQDAKWTCLTKSPPREAAELYVLRVTVDDAVEPLRVGTVSESGNITMSVIGTARLQGLPVFIKK